MKIRKLLAALSDFDPECEVQVLNTYIDWVYSGDPERGSMPVGRVEWVKCSTAAIAQERDGTVRIGLEEIS